MGFVLQKDHGLPVLAVRLGQDGDMPCADLRLVDNRGGDGVVVDSRLVPLEAFGCDDEPGPSREVAYEHLRVPAEMDKWVGAWAAEVARPSGSPLWLHLVKPYGVLGAVPWERDLQPAIQVPLLRLPDVLPDQDHSRAAYDVALVATAPAPEGPSTAARMGPAVARAIAGGVGGRMRLHVFADAEARGFLRHELADLPVRSVVVHDVEPERPRAGDTRGELRNGWLRWIRRAMAGQNLDAVHFIVHGNALGSDGAVLTPLEPDALDRAWPVSVSGEELRVFLTQVGALVVGFSRPSDNYSDFGLRRLVDDLGAVRAGPVLLHDDRLDPSLGDLRAGYAFLTAARGIPPATPSLSLVVQPHQVGEPDSLAPPPMSAPAPMPPPMAPSMSPPSSSSSDSFGRSAAVQEHFGRDETPMWLAAAERYLEEQHGRLIRFQQALADRTPTSAEQAHYDGVASALQKVRDVVEKYARETL